MRAPDGSWWYTHQLVQNRPAPFEGRPQMLEPVQWIDGWPIIGKDVNGDGIGEPVLHHRKPIPAPDRRPADGRRFRLPQLGLQWEWNHNPRDTHWSLTERPGWLRLRASVPVGKGGFWKACNTISQRIMGTGRGEALAKFDLSGMKPGQRAGFVRFGGVYHLLGVHVEPDGTAPVLRRQRPDHQRPGDATSPVDSHDQRRRTGPILLLDRRRHSKSSAPRSSSSSACGRATGSGSSAGTSGSLGHIDVDCFRYSTTARRRPVVPTHVFHHPERSGYKASATERNPGKTVRWKLPLIPSLRA